MKSYGYQHLKDKLDALTIVLPTGCWQWVGSINHNGYGKVSLTKTKYTLAHILSYFLSGQNMPDDMELDHICRHTWCVNPYHLEAVTHIENVRRGNAGKYLKEKRFCKQGHEYTPENTKLVKGGRDCKICCKNRSKEYRKKASQVNLTNFQ